MATTAKPHSFLVLNNVRSAFNVGSCFRICDSLNIGLILQGITPYPKVKNDLRLPYVAQNATNKIKKTATESIDNIWFKYFSEATMIINYLNANKVPIYVLENNKTSSKNLFLNIKSIKKPFALVVGNEVEGVEDSFLNVCKKTVYLPMYGKNKSLNVSSAAAVALYSIIHQN